MLKRLFILAMPYMMADDAPGAAPVTPAPTKESLIQRIEDLCSRGLLGAETMLHEAIAFVEDAFSTDDGATLNVSVEEEAGNAAPAANAATDAQEQTPTN